MFTEISPNPSISFHTFIDLSAVGVGGHFFQISLEIEDEIYGECNDTGLERMYSISLQLGTSIRSF